ncbi:MAG TPA: flagellar transcriptional regulator FlhD [Azospirillaceae bacterium]|nr:flagellar transcriptional regulator FlhD [Azospirillaceae bacterium]
MAEFEADIRELNLSYLVLLQQAARKAPALASALFNIPLEDARHVASLTTPDLVAAANVPMSLVRPTQLLSQVLKPRRASGQYAAALLRTVSAADEGGGAKREER